MRLRNLTPHDIHVYSESDLVITLPPAETPARCTPSRTQVGSVTVGGATVPLNITTFGPVVGLPAQQDGVFLVVSSIVARALPDRTDLIVPDDTVIGADGRVAGCRAFARI